LRDIVVVFARAPRLGAIKRRLARGIGPRATLRFYLATLAATLRSLRADDRFRVVLAVTPDRAAARWPVRVPVVRQGRGDLGVRMHRACNRFCRRRVVLIGSDIPDLRPSDVAAALRALGSADAVFGPALDGGYWLVGMSPRRPAKPFAGVRWSSEHALADTLANFRGRRVALLRTLRDVDTAADFHAVRKAAQCRAKAQPTPPIPPRRSPPVPATRKGGSAGG
jgi:rSAM/selenodomain-associated transferase 1